MKKNLLQLSILSASLAVHADSTLTWYWTDASFGATGTLTTASSEITVNGNTGYLVTAATGNYYMYSFLGGEIGGIAPVGTAVDSYEPIPADNLIIPTSPGFGTVDSYGIAFLTPHYNSNMAYVKTGGYITWMADGSTAYPMDLTITDVVPEPGSVALASLGVAGLLARRRNAKTSVPV